MKLTIEHLAPYLPYGLKMNTSIGEGTLIGIIEQRLCVKMKHQIDSYNYYEIFDSIQPFRMGAS